MRSALVDLRADDSPVVRADVGIHDEGVTPPEVELGADEHIRRVAVRPDPERESQMVRARLDEVADGLRRFERVNGAEIRVRSADEAEARPHEVLGAHRRVYHRARASRIGLGRRGRGDGAVREVRRRDVQRRRQRRRPRKFERAVDLDGQARPFVAGAHREANRRWRPERSRRCVEVGGPRRPARVVVRGHLELSEAVERRELSVGSERQSAHLVRRTHVGEQIERVGVTLGTEAALKRCPPDQRRDARAVDDERVRRHDAVKRRPEREVVG